MRILIQKDDYLIENEKQKCCEMFISFIKKVVSKSGINFFGENSTKLYFIKINITLFFQHFIIHRINLYVYENNLNEIFNKSEKSQYIIFGINSGIVLILWAFLYYMIQHELSSCLENLLYFFIFIYIPIINFYCLLIPEKKIEDYILYLGKLINTINLLFSFSSVIFDFGTYRGIFLFLLFDIGILFLIEEGRFTESISDLIPYSAYSIFCKYFSYSLKKGCKFGVVISNYFILFPIVLLGGIIIIIIILLFVGFLLK